MYQKLSGLSLTTVRAGDGVITVVDSSNQFATAVYSLSDMSLIEDNGLRLTFVGSKKLAKRGFITDNPVLFADILVDMLETDEYDSGFLLVMTRVWTPEAMAKHAEEKYKGIRWGYGS